MRRRAFLRTGAAAAAGPGLAGRIGTPGSSVAGTLRVARCEPFVGALDTSPGDWVEGEFEEGQSEVAVRDVQFPATDWAESSEEYARTREPVTCAYDELVGDLPGWIEQGAPAGRREVVTTTDSPRDAPGSPESSGSPATGRP